MGKRLEKGIYFRDCYKNPELLTKPFRRQPKSPVPPKLLVPHMSILSLMWRVRKMRGRMDEWEKGRQTQKFFLLFSLSPILPFVLLLGCGYVSTSEYLSHIKTINIPMATNRTVEYGLEEEVTKSLTDRFRRRWNEGNDLIFTMTITEFKYEPIRFDANNFPEQYSYIIKLDYTLEDRIEGKTISEKKDYLQRHNFYVVQGRGEEPENFNVAKEKLIRELADQLYSDLAEQW